MERSFPRFIDCLDNVPDELKTRILGSYKTIIGNSTLFTEAIATDITPPNFIPSTGVCVNPQTNNPYFDEKTTIGGKRGYRAKMARHQRGGATNMPPAGRTSLGIPGNCRFNQ